MSSIIYFSVLVILSCSLVDSQEICQTLKNETGTCIPLHFCKPFLDLLEGLPTNQPIPLLIKDIIQKSACAVHNSENYVCCANIYITTMTTTTTTAPTTKSTIIDRGASTTLRSEPLPITEIAPKFGNIQDISNHPNLNLLPENCGLLLNTDRLSNGNKTAINEFPFMALLRYDTSEGLVFKCGGTIISQRYILTAAHCVRGPGLRVVSVRVGEHDISTPRDCETYEYLGIEECAPPVEDIDVEEIIPYPWYNDPNVRNDIALIRLGKNINVENSNMKPICLPVTNESQYKILDELLTAGWGYTESNMTSDILLKAKLPVVGRERCQEKYTTIPIIESHICAGGDNKIDTCHGDSGGPLFFTGRLKLSVRYIQYGVVAAGYKVCGGNDTYPGLYTRISHYMKWILDHLKP